MGEKCHENRGGLLLYWEGAHGGEFLVIPSPKQKTTFHTLYPLDFGSNTYHISVTAPVHFTEQEGANLQ